MAHEALKDVLKNEVLRLASLARALSPLFDGISHDHLVLEHTSEELLKQYLEKRMVYLLRVEEEAAALSEDSREYSDIVPLLGA